MGITEGAVLVQYVFLDVVRFTQGRTTEAQADIIAKLNEIVVSALDSLNVPKERRIFSPSGDGLAIALLQPDQFDLGLSLALDILKRLHGYNSGIEDKRRRFEVRVGINQNIDNLLMDINGNRNVVGRGINQAQRIMDLAEGSQVLMGDSVYEVLCEREYYDKHFRSLPGTDKHGNRFNVHQLIQPADEAWLNTEVPTKFQPKAQKVLSIYVAHFICNAVVARDFLLQRRDSVFFEYVSTALLHLLTKDSMENISKNPLEKPYYRIDRDPNGTPDPTWKALENSEPWLLMELCSSIKKEKLNEYSECFEEATTGRFFPFPLMRGIERVKAEHPKVWSWVVESSASLKSTS